MNRVIFIVGTPRSGTTLLQDIMHKKFDSLSTLETHFFSNLYNKNPLKRAFLFKRNLIEESIRRISNEYVNNCEYKKLKNLGENDFFYAISFELNKTGKNVFIEKTPMHLRFVKEIEAAALKNDFEVYFLHIIRNKFENVRSLYNATNTYAKSWGGKRSIEKCNLRWGKDMLLHFKYTSCERHCFVRYEDLLVRHQSIVDAIQQSWGWLEERKESELKYNDIIDKHEHWKSNNKEKIGTNTNYAFMLETEFYEKYPYSNREKCCKEVVESNVI